MITRNKKLSALLEWMFQSVGEELLAMLVFDRQGLTIASLLKDGVNEEVLGGMTSLVEPVLRRISKEFKSGNFGTGSFDTEMNRLIFCEAGPDAILVLVADILTSLDDLFPYVYLAAEKISRLLDNRPVSPVIPSFKNTSSKIEKSDEIRRIFIEKGSYILKCVLAGDGDVGKTTLVNQFVQGKFEKDYKSTIGTSIMKKAVKFHQWDVEVRLTIFDLAGQKQFIRVRNIYYKGAKAGLLVYDVTRPETFKNLEKWFNDAKKVEPGIMFVLIANKIDLKDERKVSEEEGKAFADKIDIPYFETSALNKDIVDEAFTTLAFLFIQSNNVIENIENRK